MSLFDDPDATFREHRVSLASAYAPMLFLLAFSVKLYLNQCPLFPEEEIPDGRERRYDPDRPGRSASARFLGRSGHGLHQDNQSLLCRA
jgi:hypothetical protein